MKRPSLIILVALVLSSCAPVLRQELMKVAAIDVPLSDIRKNPDLYKGKLFLLGGVIVNTRLTEKGSMIEAVYVPVDSRGYLRGIKLAEGRFMAIFPKDRGLLDPIIYRRGREITLAGELIETHKGRIDELEFTYPVFEIKELYLWEERRLDYIPPVYPSWYYPYPYWWYEPWWSYYPPPYYWYGHPLRR